MHGIIFLALEDFLESQRGEGAWSRAMRKANLEEQDFVSDRFYPDEDAANLFAASAIVLGVPLAHTLELLGIHMSPGLLTVGRAMGMIREEWRTLDILEHLPKTILAVFQLQYSADVAVAVSSPDIRTYRPKFGEVAVAYVSERKLCHLLKGIILGMGKVFGEPIRFQERVCLLEHAPLCRISVYLDDPVLQNYVDIAREFHIVQSRIQEIRLFNQFQGIPIINPGLVLQYTEENVMIQIHSDSLLAMRTEGVTYLTLPHLPLGLKARISKVNMSQGIAVLQQITMTDGPVGKRIFPRVVPAKPIDLELRLCKQTLRGWIANLSESGICMVFKHHALLEETMLFTPIKVRFVLPVQNTGSGDLLEFATKKIVLDGNILNIDENRGRHTVRIVFTPPTVQNLLVIRAYFKKRQQETYLNLKVANSS